MLQALLASLHGWQGPWALSQCIGAGKAPQGTAPRLIRTDTSPTGASGKGDAVTDAHWFGAVCALDRTLSQSCASRRASPNLRFRILVAHYLQA